MIQHPSQLDRRTLLKWAAGSSCLAALPLGKTAGANETPLVDRSCIFIWLNGGPSQFETFDPKPEAKAEVRGPFGALRTRVPGLILSELVPQLARRAEKFSLIRSLTHSNPDHSSKAMLTGSEMSNVTFGAVVTKLLGSNGSMPPYVHIGSSPGDGSQIPSNIDLVGADRLGMAYEPLRIRAPATGNVQLGSFVLGDRITREELDKRVKLLERMQNDEFGDAPAVMAMREQRRKALELLTSSSARDAFDMSREDERTRYRYGANFFGQSCLLARRLIEAGTRYVQIKWYDVVAFDAWDTHGADLPGMRRTEQQLCPRLDQGLSALIDDLEQRGLLDSTLVVVLGEFGRTPQINNNGDRDHWPHCFSALLAGAGLPGGAVVGQSDGKGAYPVRTPVRPYDFAATIYRLLGIDTANDFRIRPFIEDGVAISELVS